ncbi:MAG: lipoprotein chaperone [Rickettsiales bacterium]|jgi:outer membrane lipoprotein-sorting protein|nr:lipoprotein chaperone [Rickettsiales bacterium]
MMLKKFGLLSLLLLLSSPAMAKPVIDESRFPTALREDFPSEISPEASKALKEKNRETLTRVSDYLNSLTTLVARFEQFAPDGTPSEGKFYLSRPGKFRWEYAPPMPILIVGNGDSITYLDYELEEITYLNVPDSLASFLTKKNINFFDAGVLVVAVSNEAGVIRVTLMQTEKPEEGGLTLILKENPVQLMQMEATDAMGQVTSVAFSELNYGSALDKKLFVAPHPKYTVKSR